MLVLLRVSVGWHFLYQGISKLNNPDFSSEAFLRQSKGPLAPTFRGMIEDVDGVKRLNNASPSYYVSTDKSKKIAGGTWKQYFDEFNSHYKLSPDQQKAASKLLNERYAMLVGWYRENTVAIRKYLAELERLEKAEKDARYRDVEYQQKRIWDKRQELAGQVKPWLDELATAEESYKIALDGILDKDQIARANLPHHKSTMLDSMNGLILFSNLAIGICLIVGLFTRFSSWCGAAFLFLIVLSQPALPNLYPPPHPSVGSALIVNKEFIEMVALMVLGCTAVGRWGGLDFFINQFLTNYLFAKKTEEGNS